MKNSKKVLALVLAFVMVLGTMNTAFAATSNAAEAQVLYDLELFDGKSADEYMPALEDAATAPEALKLIGTALGWTVDETATTDFTDVPEWAVPWVAKAVELGITNGVSDTEFGADVIDGKRVVTWFLRALGYDMTEAWEDTDTLAETAGLTVPTATLRDDVVGVIYEGLSAKKVGSETTLIEDIVAANPALEDIAAGASLIDPVKAVITEAVALDNTVVDVTLKEAVKNAPAASKFMVKTGTTEVAVSAAVLKDAGMTVRLTTAELTANTLYELTFDGVTVKFVGMADDATKPKLSSAVATTNTEVKLTFDEKVDDNALSIANYAIDGLSVLKAEFELDADDKEIKTSVILTTAAQTQGTIYKVIVTNVTDLVGNVIDADNDEYQFGGLAADTTKPKLSTAVALTNTTVELTFDENVDEATAENIANYAIDGLSVLTAERQTNKAKVVLTTVAQTQGTIYKVVVTNVTDVAGNVINSDNDEYQFGGLAPDTTKPKLSSAVGLSNTTVKLTFDENVDETTAEDIANYSIDGLTIVKAERQTTKSEVKLTTSAQTQGTIYKVVVTNVTDVAGNVINSDNDEYQFGGMASDTTKPEVVSAVSQDNKTVRVTFNEDMDETTAKQAFNYYFGSELGYGSAVTKVSATVWDVTTAAQESKVYTLDVTGVQDAAGNVLNEDKDETTFGGTGVADTTKPKVVSAVAVNATTYQVTFNEEVAKASAETATNYTISVSSGTQSGSNDVTGAVANAASLGSDKKTVTLQFNDANEFFTAGVVYKVVVANVTDVATTPNTVDADNNDALFAGNSTSNPAPKVSSVILTNSQTMVITFSEPVTVAGGFDNNDVPITAGYAGAAIDNESLSEDKTQLTVYWNTAFVAGTLYEVTVSASDITDELGLVALDTASDANKKTFAGISSSPSSPKISAVVAVDINTIDVVFDQMIVSTLASTTPGDIIIEDASGVDLTGTIDDALVRTEGDDNNKLRIFLDANLTAGSLYSVKLDESKVVNKFGTAMAAADDEKSFAAVSTANAAPKMISASAIGGGNTVEVTFSETIQGFNADGSNFNITASNGATVTGAAFKAGKTDVVVLTLSGAQTATDVIEITLDDNSNVDDVMDEAGVGEADYTVKVSYVAD